MAKYLKPDLWRKLNAAKPYYQEAERLAGVPWALLAAIHYRENTLAPSSPNAGGPMQADPPWTRAQCAACAKQYNTTITYPATSLRDAIIMCAWFIQKYKASPHLTPNSSRDDILNAAYKYNGTGYGSIAASPYVSNDPLNGKTLAIRGTINGVSIVRPDAKGGVNVILDEIASGAPLVSTSGNAIPAVTVASSTVYYPIVRWARVKTSDGRFNSTIYRQLLGAWHTGQDCNIGSGDDDLGEPVYAIADGVVEYAGFQGVWGHIVLIHHPQLGVWSQYGHFRDMLVATGQSINAGVQIGTIGKGDLSVKKPFLAHLHFEIRVVSMPPGHWPGGSPEARAEIYRNYRDPLEWLRQHHAQDVPVGGVTPSDLHPELIRIRGAMIAWLRVNHHDLRFVTVLTYAPPLAPSLGAATRAPARLGPHNVHPALAFDYRLKNAATGELLGCLDPVYATLGQYAEKQGGQWGPHASPPPANEAGNLRNHIQLKNTEAAVRDAEQRAAQGLIPAGTTNTTLAAQDSDPAKADEIRRQNCPAPDGN